MVVNHGVPEDLQRRMIEAYSDFFDMKDEEKQRYNGERIFDPIAYNTSFSRTGTEVLYWRDTLTTKVHPTFHSPDQPQNFRLSSEEFARQTREITKQLLGAICESLGLEKNRMESSLSLECCYQTMLASLYPPCPQPDLALGLPPHSDSGLLTLIMQSRSSFSGLQVQHCGKWVPVQPILPNSFCIFVSDLLQIFSNGKFKSVVHRGMVDKRSSRLSVASLIGPPLEGVLVSPAHELVEAETKPDAYGGITYELIIYQPPQPPHHHTRARKRGSIKSRVLLSMSREMAVGSMSREMIVVDVTGHVTEDACRLDERGGCVSGDGRAGEG
ncbi:Leucoanthocyanidin dioxygenase [Platanthera zijinensis]|uniref:Leucoanthocyanidin dioxygenase n=1 Tax=Platanthera zijinensis TaxID=2320716 RepID=A0AAP0B847_9ASPA